MGKSIRQIADDFIGFHGRPESELQAVKVQIGRIVKGMDGSEAWKTTSKGGRTTWDIPRDAELEIQKELREYNQKKAEAEKAKIAKNEKRLARKYKQLMRKYDQEQEDARWSLAQRVEIQEELTEEELCNRQNGPEEPSELKQEVFYLRHLLEGLVSFVGELRDRGSFDFNRYKEVCRELQRLECLTKYTSQEMHQERAVLETDLLDLVPFYERVPLETAPKKGF